MILRVLFFSILSTLLIGPVGSVTLPWENIRVSLTDFFAFSLSLYWLFHWKEILRDFHKDRIMKAFLLFCFVCFVSLILTPVPMKQEQYIISGLYLFRYMSYFSIYLSAAYLIRTKQSNAKEIGRYVVRLGCLLAFLGWVQYFLYPNLRNLEYLGWDPHYWRIFGTYLDPNYFGLMMVLAMIGLYKATPCKSKAWPCVILVCFLFVTLLFTYSRSSYLALLAAGSYILVVQKKIFVLLVAILAFACFLVLLPRPAGVGVQLERTFSIAERMKNWQLGLSMYRQYPVLGVGFNTLRFARGDFEKEPVTEEWNHAASGLDNSFIFVLATTGTIGFLAYAGLINSLFIRGNLLSRASLLGITVHTLFLNSLFFPWILVWIWTYQAVHPFGTDPHGE